MRIIASPLWAPVLDVSQTTLRAPGHLPKGIGSEALYRAQERTLGRPNPQSIVALTDFAARSDRVIRSSA